MSGNAINRLSQAMLHVRAAVEKDDNGQVKEAYNCYLNSMNFMINALRDDFANQDFAALCNQETAKLLKLVQHCHGRATDIISSVQVNADAPLSSTGLYKPRFDGDKIDDKTGDVGSQDAIKKMILSLPTPPSRKNKFSSSLKRAKTVNSLDKIKNQQMLQAYQRRLGLQRYQTEKGNLDAFRKTVEDMMIEKARRKILNQKLEERREKLRLTAEQRFLDKTGSRATDAAHEKEIYARILEFEQETAWPQNLREQLSKDPENIKLIEHIVKTVLSAKEHPLGQQMAEMQYALYRELAMLAANFKAPVFRFDKEDIRHNISDASEDIKKDDDLMENVGRGERDVCEKYQESEKEIENVKEITVFGPTEDGMENISASNAESDVIEYPERDDSYIGKNSTATSGIVKNGVNQAVGNFKPNGNVSSAPEKSCAEKRQPRDGDIDRFSVPFSEENFEDAFRDLEETILDELDVDDFDLLPSTDTAGQMCPVEAESEGVDSDFLSNFEAEGNVEDMVREEEQEKSLREIVFEKEKGIPREDSGISEENGLEYGDENKVRNGYEAIDGLGYKQEPVHEEVHETLHDPVHEHANNQECRMEDEEDVAETSNDYDDSTEKLGDLNDEIIREGNSKRESYIERGTDVNAVHTETDSNVCGIENIGRGSVIGRENSDGEYNDPMKDAENLTAIGSNNGVNDLKRSCDCVDNCSCQILNEKDNTHVDIGEKADSEERKIAGKINVQSVDGQNMDGCKHDDFDNKIVNEICSDDELKERDDESKKERKSDDKNEELEDILGCEEMVFSSGRGDRASLKDDDSSYLDDESRETEDTPVEHIKTCSNGETLERVSDGLNTENDGIESTDTMPADAESNDVVPGDGASEDVVPGDGEPSNAVPTEVVSDDPVRKNSQNFVASDEEFQSYKNFPETEELRTSMNKIVKNIHLSLDKLHSLLIITYDELDLPIGRDQSYAVVECLFFKPLWQWVNLAFRRLNVKKEITMYNVIKERLDNNPTHFSVREKFALLDRVADENNYPYKSAVEEIRKVVSFSSPLDKLECIVLTTKLICKCVNDYWVEKGDSRPPTVGCDDLLPILTYVVVKAALPQLVSECNAMEEFIHESYLLGEEGYCLTTLSTAIAYSLTLQS